MTGYVFVSYKEVQRTTVQSTLSDAPISTPVMCISSGYLFSIFDSSTDRFEFQNMEELLVSRFIERTGF
jgi:hypothetical protein